MTDGGQRIFGMEYQRLPSLSINTLPGVKILVSDVPVRHGLLLLSNKNTVVLGGQVQELVALENKKREKWELSQKGFLSHDSEGHHIDLNSHSVSNNTANNNDTPTNYNNTNINNQNTSSSTDIINYTNITTNHANLEYDIDQPFVYLYNLMNRNIYSNQNILHQEFVILATITKVVPPLCVKNNKYKLTVIVDDGSMAMQATLCDTLIETLMGNITATEFLALGEYDKTVLQKAQQMSDMLSTIATLMLVHFTLKDNSTIKMTVNSYIKPQLKQINRLCMQLKINE